MAAPTTARPAGRASARGRRGRLATATPSWRVLALFLGPCLLLLVLTRVGPFVATVVQALGQDGDLFATFGDLFRSPTFTASVRTTLWFSLLINPFQIGLALLLAVLLTQRLPATGLWRTLVFVPVAVPPAVSAIIWGLALRTPDGLVNGLLGVLGVQPQPFLTSAGQALPSIIVIATWVGVGYWMMLLIAAIQDVPRDLLEAAAVDGAGWWRRFRHVTVPQLRRPLLFVLVADTVANFLLFVPVQLLTRGGPAGSTDLLMYEIYRQAFTYGDRRLAAAEVLVLVGLMMVIVAAQMRLLGREDDG
ncbi:sugar ABC transporter permease [Nitriliruptoraceae bacterium ZYF776]|nr:sugar ABC transporter permease [Profundirhabdus halotolerans]